MRLKFSLTLASLFLCAFAVIAGPIEKAKAALALTAPAASCQCSEGDKCVCTPGSCVCQGKSTSFYPPRSSCPECEAAAAAQRALALPAGITLTNTPTCANGCCAGTCGGSYTFTQCGSGKEGACSSGACSSGTCGSAPQAGSGGQSHPVLYRIFHPFKGRQGGGRRGCCK